MKTIFISHKALTFNWIEEMKTEYNRMCHNRIEGV